mgnify:CR=1 FL=1
MEKEIPKEKESGFSMGKVLGYAFIGVVTVAAVAAVAASMLDYVYEALVGREE